MLESIWSRRVRVESGVESVRVDHTTEITV